MFRPKFFFMYGGGGNRGQGVGVAYWLGMGCPSIIESGLESCFGHIVLNDQGSKPWNWPKKALHCGTNDGLYNAHLGGISTTWAARHVCHTAFGASPNYWEIPDMLWARLPHGWLVWVQPWGAHTARCYLWLYNTSSIQDFRCTVHSNLISTLIIR